MAINRRDAREAVFDRFRTLYIKALNELQKDTDNSDNAQSATE